jgi:cytochrome P450
MTATASSADLNSGELPEFPMARAAGCPFDPAPALREIQQDGGLSRVRLWDGSTPWLVTRYGDQRALLADPRISTDSSRSGYPHENATIRAMTAAGSLSFTRADPPKHTQVRRMVTAPFSIKRVEALRPAVQRLADRFIDDLLAGPKPVDLVAAFAVPLTSLVIFELLGVPHADHDYVQANARAGIDPDASPEEKAAATKRQFDYLDSLMGEKLRKPADDLLSRLAVEQVNTGQLARREAVHIAIILVVAGHDTSANMIALGTLALLEHPEQLALLRETDDPKVVAGAVEELLRYLTVAHDGRRRVALQDIEIGGQTIRAGEGVIMSNEIGNRDPDAFADPDRLDLTRDARHHVAFAFGIHQCLGQSLARMELQVVYGTLYKRIPTLRLATETDQLRFRHDEIVYGVYSLPVTW